VWHASGIMRWVVFSICLEDRVGLHGRSYPMCKVDMVDLMHAHESDRHYLFGGVITGNECESKARSLQGKQRSSKILNLTLSRLLDQRRK